MLPATRGAEVVYHNVVRPLVGQAKARPAATNPFNKPEGYTTAAPSSFERESATLRRCVQPCWLLWAAN
jgi:receptor expression-enhancing protein 5/6